MSTTETADTRIGASLVYSTVASHIGRLQAAADSPATRASLAHLRANLGVEPGQDPRIWSLTLKGLDTPEGDFGPTRAEVAVHGAMTLYAHHQRARTEPMSVAGVGLGTALRICEYRIYGGEADESPLRRRFDAAVMASDIVTLQHRLRSLLGQMRAESVALDYPQLAQDFYRWQWPDGSDSVRRRWARQYYHVDPASMSDSNEATEAAAPATPEED